MVVSKRCKVCTIIEPNSMPISSEYFGKQIPEMIENISGIALDPKKVIDVLICQQCAILLVHTESVVSKLRKSLVRLKIPLKTKNITPKTPSKSQETGDKVALKQKILKKSPAVVKVNGDVSFQKISDETKSLDDSLLTGEVTPAKKKKTIKRKLDSLYEGINGKAMTSKRDQSNQELPNDGTEIDLGECTPKQKQRKKTTSISFNETILEIDETDMNAITTVTNKIKVLDCVLCGKKFNQKMLLREHIETSHMGEKLKECPNCSTEFRSLQKYESHVFGEKCKSTLHPCQFENCHKQFKSVYKMEAHMRDKHRSENVIESE